MGEKTEQGEGEPYGLILGRYSRGACYCAAAIALDKVFIYEERPSVLDAKSRHIHQSIMIGCVCI